MHIGGIVLSGGLLAQPSAPRHLHAAWTAKGRRLTADRPIPECIDREQRELSPSGTGQAASIAPDAHCERSRQPQDDKARKAAEERNALGEEQQRERALLTRYAYPDRAAHDKERALALAQADEVIATASKRIAELATQSARAWTRSASFKNDPRQAAGQAEAPDRVKRADIWTPRSASSPARRPSRQRA